MLHADVEPRHNVRAAGGHRGRIPGGPAVPAGGRGWSPSKSTRPWPLPQRRFNELGLASLCCAGRTATARAPDPGSPTVDLVSQPQVRDKALPNNWPRRLPHRLEGANSTYPLARYEVSNSAPPGAPGAGPGRLFRDTGMTLLDMGMVDQVMLPEARRTARQKTAGDQDPARQT